ncbi:hypothetical protein L7F22_055518 [Adiantum nelumboides]|nr:hypothetical protein [Adiantum nelumboides]
MAVQKKAWMTGELFQAWLEHFDKAITELVGKESRHLLILDGHGSHVSLEVVERARDWGIDLITLPAHTSHKLRPLDVSVFKSLKTHFRKERDIWHLRTLSRQASKTEVATIAAKAIGSALTEANIKSGFKATEIWPFNPNALNFDNMPCNHISILEEATTREEDLSQVPNTFSFPNREEEAIYALNTMANQLLDEDTFLEDTSTVNGVTYIRLMEEDDEDYFKDLGHQETPSTPGSRSISPTFATSQCRRQLSEANQLLSQPMLRNSNDNTYQVANSSQAANPALYMQGNSFGNQNTHVNVNQQINPI